MIPGDFSDIKTVKLGLNLVIFYLNINFVLILKSSRQRELKPKHIIRERQRERIKLRIRKGIDDTNENFGFVKGLFIFYKNIMQLCDKLENSNIIDILVGKSKSSKIDQSRKPK